MKIYESRLTWILGYIIVTSLFFYNFIVLPFGFMWFVKSLICFGCGAIIFWTKLFKKYPKPIPRGIPSEVFKNEREEIWNSRRCSEEIWDNMDIWHVKHGRIRR